MKNWIKLVISLALPQVIGGTAALFTSTGVNSWFRTIEKPEWNPPNWVFAPVWTTLYILMGIAFYLVWKTDAPARKKKWAMGLWLAQLILNFCWSLIFFYQQQIAGALLEMALLWIMILITIFAFARIHKLAAWLMVPYISWVSFAFMLNYAIWDLNR